MKRLVKTLLRWEQRSTLQKGLVLYRVRYAIAAVISWLPIPAWWLLQGFGSDKHRAGSHAYGLTYQALFRRLKYRHVKLLEIGVGGDTADVGGRSLLSWRAYFPRAALIGFDLYDRSRLSIGKITILQGDQDSPADLAQLVRQAGPFDIIIDDGSHLSRHQLCSFRRLFDALTEGGLYIIEDVGTSYWPCRVGSTHWDGAHPDEPGFASTCVGFFLDMAKHLNHAEFLVPIDPDSPFVALMGRIRRISFEHNMIVVEKGVNDSDSMLWLLHRTGYEIEPEALAALTSSPGRSRHDSGIERIT